MSECLKRSALIFLAVRAVIDLAIGVLLYRQMGELMPVIGWLCLCAVFYVFLISGLTREEFPGRYGQRVSLWREPIGYWFVVGFLIVAHLALSVLFATQV